MSKWYRRHDEHPEIAVCKLCGKKFYVKEAGKVDKCPICKHDGEKDKGMQEILDRIKGR